jgi:hypothetical protein
MFDGALREGSEGGTTGRPGKLVVEDGAIFCSVVVADIEAVDFVSVARCWMMVFRWYRAIAMMAKRIEVNDFMDTSGQIYIHDWDRLSRS